MSIVSERAHPIEERARAILAALEDVRETQPVYMTPEQKESALHELHQAEAAIAELRLRVLSAADEEWVQGRGHRDATAWLATTTHCDPASARAEVKLAEALDRRWSGVAAAMAAGTVSVAHARAIVESLDALPDHIDNDVIARAEAELTAQAEQFRPSELRRLGRHILDVVAPEVAEAEEAQRLLAEESHARDTARLRLRRLGGGTTRISGLLPDADATRLQTYLEAYTSPRHPGAGEGDRIPHHRKLAHAFMALLEQLDPTNLPEHGGDATTVLVTVSLAALRAELATAGIIGPDLDHGPDLSAAHARLLACQAKIIPVVLGGEGEILDLGRARRLFTPAQRRAIRLRDKRCRAAGCTVKAQWTEIHHLRPWQDGGTTDLSNGICLCAWHHHRIDDPRYAHERLADGDIHIHIHRRT